MDVRLGRWFNPDPYGQHHSPYLAMSNNPVNSVDPDGGTDYYVDGMLMSGFGANSLLNSGAASITGSGNLDYGTTLGYSYNGENFYGSHAFSNASNAQKAHWGTLGIFSFEGEYYQKYNFAFASNYGNFKGSAGLSDVTDWANTMLAFNARGKELDFFNTSAQSVEKGNKVVDLKQAHANGGSGKLGLGLSIADVGIGFYSGYLYNHDTYISTKGKELGFKLPNGKYRETAQAMKYMKYSKFLKGLATKASVLSTAYSGYKVFSGRGSTMDKVDFGVGVFGLGAGAATTFGILSNPVGWGIGIGVGIYGGARLLGDVIGNYNPGRSGVGQFYDPGTGLYMIK